MNGLDTMGIRASETNSGIMDGGMRLLRGATSSTVLLLALSLGACTATTYNIDFHSGAFRVSDKLTVEPGQGGDDSSSTAGGAATGGSDGAPGGSNLLRGSAMQGNIFQIGTSQKPTTTTDLDATVPAGP